MARAPRTPAAMPKPPPRIAPMVGAAFTVAMVLRVVVVGTVVVVDVDLDVESLLPLGKKLVGDDKSVVEESRVAVG